MDHRIAVVNRLVLQRQRQGMIRVLLVTILMLLMMISVIAFEPKVKFDATLEEIAEARESFVDSATQMLMEYQHKLADYHAGIIQLTKKELKDTKRMIESLQRRLVNVNRARDEF